MRQCGGHPAVDGAKPGRAVCGFTHTTRWASRASQAICSPRSAGSPRSQPSEAITTTAPWAAPRCPCCRTNSASSSPSRVPPDQSGIAAVADRERASGSATAELARDPGQPGAHREDLGAAPGPGHRVSEQQRPLRVRSHRAADVEQEHDAARPAGRRVPVQQGRLAALRARSPATSGVRRRGRAAPGDAGGTAGSGRRARSAATSRRARSRSASSSWPRSALRRISSSLAVASHGRSGPCARRARCGRGQGRARPPAGRPGSAGSDAVRIGRRSAKYAANAASYRSMSCRLRARGEAAGPVHLRAAGAAELVDGQRHAVHAVRRRGDSGAAQHPSEPDQDPDGVPRLRRHGITRRDRPARAARSPAAVRGRCPRGT